MLGKRDLLYGRLFFDGENDGKGGGGNPPNPEPKPEEKPKQPDPLDGLSDEQRKLVQERIDSAAAKARRDGEKAGLTKAQQDAAAKAEEERVAKEQADAIAKGEFDKVKTELEGKAKTAEERLAKANEVIVGVLADRFKELEATGDADLIAAYPKDADPLDRLAWLNDPRTKRAMAVAAEEKRVADAKDKPRPKPTPRPNHDGKQDITSPIPALRIAG